MAALPRDRNAVLVSGGDLPFLAHGAALGYLARRYEMPAIHPYRGAVEEGALASFGTRFCGWRSSDGGLCCACSKWHQAGRLNLWTAKSRGIEICPTLARADEIIE
jgi:hypothetical protein